MATGDEVLAVAAAQRLDYLRSDRWPLVAAFLLAAGVEGESAVTLAGLSDSASGLQVDQLVPAVLKESGAPVLTVADAADVLARILAQRAPSGGDHVILRELAELAPMQDYHSDGVVGRVYALSEWLDCDCHAGSAERAEADVFEAELRELPPLRMPRGLAHAISRR